MRYEGDCREWTHIIHIIIMRRLENTRLLAWILKAARREREEFRVIIKDSRGVKKNKCLIGKASVAARPTDSNALIESYREVRGKFFFHVEMKL